MFKQLRKTFGSRTGLARAVALALALAAGACSDTPTGPCCGSSPPEPRTLVLTGTVFGDGQPLANATVLLIGEVGFLPTRTTDASGRYRVEFANGIRAGVFVSAFDGRSRLQPCATWVEPTEPIPLEKTADVHLTSATSALSVGSQTVAGRRRVSGTVRSMTATGLQPVPGVSVALLSNLRSDEEPNAWTSTNTAGRFSLCGLPIDRQLRIYADFYDESEQSFKWASKPVEPGGGDAGIELILTD